MDLKERIERQRARLADVKKSEVEVVLDGELSKVGIPKAQPAKWDELVAANPPRAGIESDSMVGYNPSGVSRAYPNVTVDGEMVDAETWADMFDVLDGVHRNNIGVVIWGVNVNDALRELRELGKARAGQKSPSPAN